jgi:Tfp pilus assembly protein PilX
MMNRSGMRARQCQRGATLLVGMVMLVLLTLLALSAINSSTVNLKVVGNMQYQQEAMNAADAAINTVMSSSGFFSTPGTAPTSQAVDVNGDGVTDYTVDLKPPPCVLATTPIPLSQLSVTNPNDRVCMGQSNLTNTGIMGQNTGAAPSNCAKVTWQVTATVNDTTNVGNLLTHANVTLVAAANQRMGTLEAALYVANTAIRCP